MLAEKKSATAEKKSAVAEKKSDHMSDVSAMSKVCAMSDDTKGHTIDKETPMDFLWAVVRVPIHLY